MHARNRENGPLSHLYGKVGIFRATCRRQEKQMRLTDGCCKFGTWLLSLDGGKCFNPEKMYLDNKYITVLKYSQVKAVHQSF